MPSRHLAQTTTAKARPGGRTERNRKAVANAVLACVKQGRLDFEIQEIAALSGVHRTTISRRWPDRGALMAEAVGEHVGQFSTVHTGDWETDIRHISQRLFDFFCEPTELAMNRMLAISDNTAFHKAMADYWMPVFQKLQEPIKRGKAEGLVRPDVDEEMVISMIFSVLTIYTAMNRLPIDPTLPIRLAEQLIVLCRQVPASGAELPTKR